MGRACLARPILFQSLLDDANLFANLGKDF